jgi:hypothetical protein
MNILNEIKSRTEINMGLFVERLQNELKITNIQDETKRNAAKEQLLSSISDTMCIILDTTHLSSIPKSLYTTWIRMTKDYWYLNGYDNQFVKNIDVNSSSDMNMKVKSIQEGDTTVDFADATSVNINGIIYNTGTLEFSEDVLVEKYKKDLYRHRKMRW